LRGLRDEPHDINHHKSSHLLLKKLVSQLGLMALDGKVELFS
jgi:hypothetical protein